MKPNLILISLMLFSSCQMSDNKQMPIRNIGNTNYLDKDSSIADIRSDISSMHNDTITHPDVSIINETSECSSIAVDNNIANNLIDIRSIDEHGINLLFNDKFIVTPEIHQGESDATYIDTLYIVKSGYSEIHMTSLKKGNYNFNYAAIADNSININYNIKIGMSKMVFMKRFNISSNNCDTLVITTDERTIMNTFVFKNSLLKELSISVLAD